MLIDIITIFPKMFAPVMKESIIMRAQEKGKVKIRLHDLRDYTTDKHRKVDDRPFGGGAGMLMRPEPIFEAVEYIIQKSKLKNQNENSKFKVKKNKPRIILLCPQGKTLTQKICKRMAKYKHLIFICGRYQGVDERVRSRLAEEEISIGDYILTGGELPAMVCVDALVRLLPGVLGDKNSLNFESFEDNLLESPHFTRPAFFKGMQVPAVLLSGDHKKIEIWRREEAMKKTKKIRPDLLNGENEAPQAFKPLRFPGAKY